MCEKLGSLAAYCVCDVSKEEDCKCYFPNKTPLKNLISLRNLVEKCIKTYSEIDSLVFYLFFSIFQK